MKLLRFDLKIPLYEQLYKTIVDEILQGKLAPESKMPSKRSLAQQLGISVNTVDTAYQMLVAEGYLASRPRSGFYVMEIEHLPQQAEVFDQKEEKEQPRWKFDFNTAGIDASLFPFRTWGKIQKELLYSKPQLLNRGQGQGDAQLRVALAQHLQQYRGVKCCPSQIVVGAGLEYLLGLLMPLLGKVIALEDPGYPKAKQVVSNFGKQSVFVPVDRYGLSVENLCKTSAQAVYITPSHQFPTGATMPVGRRTALLQWAYADKNRFIVEDDYDSEFRFDLRPIPSLQGMDSKQRVVYITTFSKSLAPSIRIACLVLPNSLAEGWNSRYAKYACTVSRFEQQTLCCFLQQGYFARHLSRMRNEYRKRMLCFKNELERCLGNAVQITGEHTGLHLVLEFSKGTTGQLVLAAQKRGMNVSGLDSYQTLSNLLAKPTVLLGYGCLHNNEITPAAELLRQAWKEFL